MAARPSPLFWQITPNMEVAFVIIYNGPDYFSHVAVAHGDKSVIPSAKLPVALSD